MPAALLLLTVILAPGCEKKNPRVEIRTPSGTIVVELYADKAPATAGNFLDLVRKGVYDGASFYRTVRGTSENNPIPIQVLQGGIRDKEDKADYNPVQHETTLETGIRHEEGTISMARNEPGSARTEFFFSLATQPQLDYGGLRNRDGQGFAAFGKIVSGLEVAWKIWGGQAAGEMLNPAVRIHEIVVK